MNCELPTLRGDRVVLRALQAADAGPLADVIVQPEVARWWGSRPHDGEHHRRGLLEDAAQNDACAWTCSRRS